MTRLLLLSCCVVLCAACSQDYRIERDFKESRWQISDTLSFDYENPTAGSTFAPEIAIGFQPDYEYQNIHLKIITVAPSGKKEQTLFEADCLDPMGNWLLEKHGDEFRGAFQPKPFSLSEQGKYRIQVVQNMRDTALREITWCGVK